MIPTNAAPPSAALTCPFCRSEKVATTSKSTDDAYWRCRECDEIWNPSRLKFPGTFTNGRPSSRY